MPESLLERMLVAATGPVVTAALAVLVVNWITARAQRRKDAYEARERLASEMTEAANTLYMALQAFWRAAREVPLSERADSPALADARRRLEETYLSTRTTGQVLEQRLQIYYRSPEPAQGWHRVIDLLTARYFLLLEGDESRRAAIRRRNAGPQHSGLTEAELKSPPKLLNAYRNALTETVHSLWEHDIDRGAQHMRHRTSQAPGRRASDRGRGQREG